MVPCCRVLRKRATQRGLYYLYELIDAVSLPNALAIPVRKGQGCWCMDAYSLFFLLSAASPVRGTLFRSSLGEVLLYFSR